VAPVVAVAAAGVAVPVAAAAAVTATVGATAALVAATVGDTTALVDVAAAVVGLATATVAAVAAVVGAGVAVPGVTCAAITALGAALIHPLALSARIASAPSTSAPRMRVCLSIWLPPAGHYRPLIGRIHRPALVVCRGWRRPGASPPPCVSRPIGSRVALAAHQDRVPPVRSYCKGPSSIKA
jgi:hypothetical protein